MKIKIFGQMFLAATMILASFTVYAASEEETSKMVDIRVDGKNYKVHLNDCGDSKNEAVIMLHGSGPGATSWANFSKNIDPLVEAGYRVILLDFPGWGKSDTVVITKNMTRSDFNGKVIGEVLNKLSIRKAHLLGNSMGGHSAVFFTLNNPDRVDKLILMGGGTGGQSLFSAMPAEGIKRLNQLYREPTIENLKLMMDIFVYDTSDLTEELFKTRLDNILAHKNHLDSFIKSLEQNPRQYPDVTPRLSEIKAKTLIIWGKNDRFVPMDTSLRLLANIDNSELHIYRNSGHWVQWEQAEGFNRLLIEFLGRK